MTPRRPSSRSAGTRSGSRGEEAPDGREPEGAAGQSARVVERDVLDDLRERERQQRGVDPEQAQRGEGEEHRRAAREEPAAEDRDRRRHPAGVQHQPARAVAAQRVDRELAEVPDAGDAQHEVPADVQHQRDLGRDDDRHVVLVVVDERERGGEHDRRGDRRPAAARQRRGTPPFTAGPPRGCPSGRWAGSTAPAGSRRTGSAASTWCRPPPRRWPG